MSCQLVRLLLPACLLLLPVGLTAQRPTVQDDSLGAFRRIRDNRAPIVRAAAESTLARVKTIEGSSWRASVQPDLGTVDWVSVAVDDSNPPAALAAPSPASALAQFLSLASGLWNVGPGRSTLELTRSSRDELGSWHFTLDERFQGVPVYGGQVKVHVRRSDNGRFVVYAAGGTVYPVTALASGGELDQASVEARARQQLAGRGATLVRALQRWIVPVAGEYVAAYAVAFGPASNTTVDGSAGTAFVRADNGEVLAIASGTRHLTAGANSGLSSAGKRSSSSIQAVAESSGSATVGSGIDVFQHQQILATTNLNGIFQLVDQTHAGASEIRVYDDQGQRRADPEPDFLSQDANNTWDAGPQGDEVSAAVNGGLVVDYYYTHFGRLSWQNQAGSILYLLVNSGPGLDAAFTPSQSSIWFLSGGTGTLVNGVASNVLPVSGAGDVMFHEFTHGVEVAEGAALTQSLVPLAISEGLADYFGTAFANRPCIADTIITSPASSGGDDFGSPTPVGCLRDLSPDVNITGAFFLQAQDSLKYHKMGLAIGSALWDAKGWAPTMFDSVVYNAVRYYIPTTPTFVMVREAVVQAEKDLEHANRFDPQIRPSFNTEQEFYANGIGNAPITGRASYSAAPAEWEGDITGEPGLTFYAQMESGIGLNNDQSLVRVRDAADNDPQFTIPANGSLHFLPGQLGWNGTRTHTPTDGHQHVMRVRVASSNSLTGDIKYYFAFGGRDPLQSITASLPGDSSARHPRFSFSQLLTSGSGLPELSGGAGSRLDDADARSARTSVMRSGITALRFGVPDDAGSKPVRVRITIYDQSGRLVRRAIDADYTAGVHDWSWDLLSGAGARVPAGAYVAIMESAGFRARQVLVVR